MSAGKLVLFLTLVFWSSWVAALASSAFAAFCWVVNCCAATEARSVAAPSGPSVESMMNVGMHRS